jgi:hypothetical protein
MSQTEILIYITVIQWTVALFGGHFVAVSEGIPVAGAVSPTLIGFLLDGLTFFGKAFLFAVPGAPLISPIWWLMSIVWFVRMWYVVTAVIGVLVLYSYFMAPIQDQGDEVTSAVPGISNLWYLGWVISNVAWIVFIGLILGFVGFMSWHIYKDRGGR